jgi:acetoin utilization protein AcuB
VTCKQPDGKYEIVIRGNIPDAEDIKSKIEAQGYKVIHSVKIG